MLKKILACILAVIVFSACEKTAAPGQTFFDSLVVANTRILAGQKATLSKISDVGGKSDTTAMSPDSAAWANELEVFRQLNAFEKPAYKDLYSVIDGRKDSQSNLTVREYKTTASVPVPMIKFYYFNSMKGLKKVEAHYRESNTLYSATRKLTMQFVDRAGKPVLSAYSLHGVQRMILSDTLSYDITGLVSF